MVESATENIELNSGNTKSKHASLTKAANNTNDVQTLPICKAWKFRSILCCKAM